MIDAVAGSPQRIGFKGGSPESPFRFLNFVFYIGSPIKNATARNAVENPVVNQAALRVGKSFHQKSALPNATGILPVMEVSEISAELNTE